MSAPNRRRTTIKKRAKSLADVHSGLLYQAVKLVTKTVKLVKGLLVLKSTRKLAELREKNENDSDELTRFQGLKDVKHADVGLVVTNRLLSIGRKSADEPVLDDSILQLFLQNSKIKDVIKDIEKHIVEVVGKNNALRAEEQSRDARALKAKNLLEKRKLSQKETTSNMFVASLDGEENVETPKESAKERKARESVKIKKSLRNKQNRLKNNKNKMSAGGEGGDKKRPFKRKSSDSATSASEGPSYYMAQDRLSEPVAKKPRSAPVVVEAAALEKSVVSGKEWKEADRLHPSWAAKQLSKHQPLTIGSAGAAPTGKKITFD